MPILPFGEYRPDITPFRGANSQTIANVVPRADGYGPVQDLVSATAALSAACRGFFYARNTDGSITVFAGTATKLANQLLVGVHSVASCEALLLAEQAGVDPEKLLHVLSRSWGQSRILERNEPLVRRRDFGPSASPLRNLLKDLTIVLELARESGLELPAAAAARRVYETLAAKGRGEWDITAPYPALLESRAERTGSGS